MRITTYEKGGNSLNPFIKLFIFLMIILCLFIMPVSAYTENFNDGEILSDWTISSGTWSVINTSSIEGGDDFYLYISESRTEGNWNYVIYKSLDLEDVTFMSFNFNTNQFDADGDSGVPYNEITFNSGLGFSLILKPLTAQSRVTATGISYSPVNVVSNTWYEIEITTAGTNVQIDINDVDGILINRQTVTYTRDVTNKFTITNYGNLGGGYLQTGTIRFDNLYTSLVPPSAINGIEWDLDQYTEGDTTSYTWMLTNSFWHDLIYKFRIQILKDGLEIDIVKVSQSGTRYQEADTSGTYEVKLQYSGLIFTNWISIDSDSVNVIPEVDSYINVPSETAIKTNFTATYLYGSTPINPIINIKVLQNDYTYKVIDTKILPLATAGTTYTTNLSISSLSPIGYYVIELYDNGQGKSFATDSIEVHYSYIPPSDVVLSSYINTTDNIYSLGGIISGSYAIDDINYTDYYTKLQVYNIDKDIISFSFIPLHQVDNFDISITNSDLDFYIDGVNRYLISTNFLIGENAVRLASYNVDGSLNEVITQKNITLSNVNDEGYGLTLSKYIVTENEIFAIKAITPTHASIIIHPLTLMGISDTTILINGSTQISHAIGIVDTYTISLVSGGETKITQIIKVFEGEEIIAPIDEDEIISDTTMSDNVNNLMSSPYLIGLLIMAVFLAIGSTSGIGGMIVTGSMGLGIVCYVGIFPWILLVIEVLVVAALMAKGVINLAGD